MKNSTLFGFAVAKIAGDCSMRVSERKLRIEEGDMMLRQVGRILAVVPFESERVHSQTLPWNHTIFHTIVWEKYDRHHAL